MNTMTTTTTPAFVKKTFNPTHLGWFIALAKLLASTRQTGFSPSHVQLEGLRAAYAVAYNNGLAKKRPIIGFRWKHGFGIAAVWLDLETDGVSGFWTVQYQDCLSRTKPEPLLVAQPAEPDPIPWTDDSWEDMASTAIGEDPATAARLAGESLRPTKSKPRRKATTRTEP